LSTARLVQQLRSCHQAQLANAHLPDDLCHRFDLAEPSEAHVQKTTRRQVVTLELSRFTAVEVIRTPSQQDNQARPARALQDLVPKGGLYGYDLIAHVGLQTYVKGRALQDVAEELKHLHIPFSSLHDTQQKFLFYLGHLHRQRAGLLRDYLQKRGGAAWLIDTTLEPGTPAYFGVQEAEENLVLGSWKIATENADEMIPCLKQASELFGLPQEVLHDLSDAMDAACRQAFDGIKHRVCHFHFVRDVGQDLLDKPQSALRELVRQLQLQSRLKEQRNGQTDWLRKHVEDAGALAQMLTGSAVTATPGALGRQVLVAFHQWLLDYASDGQRQGYPFDPYLLYFHRRVVRGSAAVDRLLSIPGVRDVAPVVLKNFSRMLREYLDNPQVSRAAEQYEEAFALLCRVRDVLRMSAQEENPLHGRYLLAAKETAQVRPRLGQLREKCREQSKEGRSAWTRQQNGVVVEHLDRYWERLFAEEGGHQAERTTNGLEATWGANKRKCRKRNGRKKLTLDFKSMAAEVMLVGNLEQARYVEVMLGGDIKALARHLADAGRTAGAWTVWRQQQTLNTARLPRRLLRQENLIETFVSAYQEHCLDGNS
jgi:hypothetical protein